MKTSLPHSPSDFLLPHILCSPYIAAPSPAVILSVSSSRRYWVHISYTPWYRLSLLLKLEVPLPQPSSPCRRYRRPDDTRLRPSHPPSVWVSISILLLSFSSPQVLSSRRYPCPQRGIPSRNRSKNSLKTVTLLQTPCSPILQTRTTGRLATFHRSLHAES